MLKITICFAEEYCHQNKVAPKKRNRKISSALQRVWLHVEKKSRSSVLRDGDMKRTARDTFIPPLHNEDVAALFFNGVCHVVHPVAHVFNVYLFTGCYGTMDTNHQHVYTCWAQTVSSRMYIFFSFLHNIRSSMLPPALLQSTVNAFFWPMKAFDRPAPWEMTLVASEENFGKEAKLLPIAEDLLNVSMWTDDVSCKLCPPDRRGPAKSLKSDQYCYKWEHGLLHVV